MIQRSSSQTAYICEWIIHVSREMRLQLTCLYHVTVSTRNVFDLGFNAAESVPFVVLKSFRIDLS